MFEITQFTEVSTASGSLGAATAPLRGARHKASDADQAVRLLLRIAPGASRAERARVAALGYEAYLEEQLNPAAIDDSPVESFIAQNLLTVAMGRAELAAVGREQGGFGRIAGELQIATLLRQLYSRRPLYQALVEFWSDVLNIQVNSAQLVVQKVIDDRDVARRHALGRFRDLIGASAKSPAMLLYLDNASNGQNGINENYARELMELHTLGVDGGYTEADVVDVARSLSGWSINRVTADFLFYPNFHDTGAKRVLGTDIPAGGGIGDGETVLDILAAHPSTGRHLATRLAKRFASDRPPAALVNDVAAAFNGSGGDITTMVRTLFLHPTLRDLPASKFKRPQEFILSTLRVLEASADANGLRVVLEALNGLGHVPYQWPAPNGYPDTQPYWLNSNAMLKRWNYAITITRGGQRGGWRVPWDSLLAGVTTLDQLVTRLAEVVGIAPLSSSGYGLWLKTALTITERQPLSDGNRNAVAATLAALMLGGEAFQLR